MIPLNLVITTAGMIAFTAAQLERDIDFTIARVGVTDRVFTVAPTLTALPGETKRIGAISGKAVGADTVHLMVRDADPDNYTVRGFGLFLADGTLFAVYGQADVLVEKSALSTLLLALDLRFPTDIVTRIVFGDANFLNPPATEAVAGVAAVATRAEVAAGRNAAKMVTPAGLAGALPTGIITLFFGADAPAGWAICNGQTVARNDGTGTITTPDLRGRVAVGVSADHALGAAFGASTQTATTKAAGDHSHAADGLKGTSANAATGVTLQYATNGGYAGGGTQTAVAAGSQGTPPALTDPGHSHAVAVTGSTASAGSHSHDVQIDPTQPSLALHYIMRL